MPFPPIDALPEEEPAVRIYFTGLMVLEPAANDTCQIFVNSSATRHFLTIEVRRKTENRPDEIMMRHVGPLAFLPHDNDDPTDPTTPPPVHGLFIEKFGGPKSVRRYTGNAAGSKGEQTFGLAIDMQDATFHKGNPDTLPDPITGEERPLLDPRTGAPRRLLDIDNLVGRPSIFLGDGILHSALTTSPDLEIVLKRRGEVVKQMPPFAKLLGVNIYLGDGERIRLKWRNQGKEATLFLEKPKPGVSYEIYVANDPLFESPAISTNPELDPKHDEFAEYYKLFTAVPTDEQFRLFLPPRPEGTPPIDRGSTDIPCMSTSNGGGGGGS